MTQFCYECEDSLLGFLFGSQEAGNVFENVLLNRIGLVWSWMKYRSRICLMEFVSAAFLTLPPKAKKSLSSSTKGKSTIPF